MYDVCFVIILLISIWLQNNLILLDLDTCWRSIQFSPFRRQLLAPGGGESSSGRRGLIAHASPATAKWGKLIGPPIFY
jgi:hypothetical protein